MGEVGLRRVVMRLRAFALKVAEILGLDGKAGE